MRLDRKFETGIIGVGSPFGADNVAQKVIVLLKPSFDPSVFKIEYFDRPGMHLLDYMKNFKTIHLVDAVMSGQPVGTIHRYEEVEILQNNDHQLSSHGLGVIEVLSLGKVLKCLPEKVIVHGIEIDKESLKNPISNTINNLCETLAKQIEIELLQCQ